MWRFNEVPPCSAFEVIRKAFCEHSDFDPSTSKLPVMTVWTTAALWGAKLSIRHQELISFRSLELHAAWNLGFSWCRDLQTMRRLEIQQVCLLHLDSCSLPCHMLCCVSGNTWLFTPSERYKQKSRFGWLNYCTWRRQNCSWFILGTWNFVLHVQIPSVTPQ